MKNPEVGRVQKGVHYSPNLHFVAFDVHIVTGTEKASKGGGEGVEEKKGEAAMFLDYDMMADVLKEAGFPLVASVVARGTFKEVEQFDVGSFESRIPEILGLKKPPNNIAEGIVMRPAKEALSERGHRFILKKKSEAFLEVAKSSRPASRSPSPKASKNAVSKDQKTIEHIGKDLERYVNENRLRSVLSKILGEISERKDAERLVRLMFNDVMEDFEDSVDSSRNDADLQEAKCEKERKEGQPKDESNEKASASTSSTTSTLEMFKNLAGRKQNQVKGELRHRIRSFVAMHIDDIIKNVF